MDIESEGWTTCPYDPAHRIPRSRIQNHLIKCEKNKPRFAICPYNATHRYPDSEIKQHCRNCPQKPIQELDKKFTGGLITVPKPILQREYLPDTDPNYECWDDEGDSNITK